VDGEGKRGVSPVSQIVLLALLSGSPVGKNPEVGTDYCEWVAEGLENAFILFR
jgi:hypothetical protein